MYTFLSEKSKDKQKLRKNQKNNRNTKQTTMFIQSLLLLYADVTQHRVTMKEDKKSILLNTKRKSSYQFVYNTLCLFIYLFIYIM